MVDPEEMSAVEIFVLSEVGPEAMLWELPAARTGNGTEAQRVAVIPQLRDAVFALADRSLIEVNDFPGWPAQRHEAIRIAAADLRPVLAPVQVWLWSGDETSLLTVSISEAGIAVLSRNSRR